MPVGMRLTAMAPAPLEMLNTAGSAIPQGKKSAVVVWSSSMPCSKFFSRMRSPVMGLVSWYPAGVLENRRMVPVEIDRLRAHVAAARDLIGHRAKNVDEIIADLDANVMPSLLANHPRVPERVRSEAGDLLA